MRASFRCSRPPDPPTWCPWLASPILFLISAASNLARYRPLFHRNEGASPCTQRFCLSRLAVNLVAVAQPFERCISDENSAKEQLAAVWSTYPAPLRVRCEQEATLVGIGSYVDLLTCLR
jgi:hypothetical protein